MNKRNRIKTFICGITCSLLIFTVSVTGNSYAENSEPSCARIDSSEIENVDTNDLDSILVKDVSMKEIDEYEEILEDGTDILLEGEEAVEIAEELDGDFISTNDEAYETIGVYLETNGSGIDSTEVVAAVIDEETGAIDEKATDELPKNEVVDIEQVTKDIQQKNAQIISHSNTQSQNKNIELMAFAPNSFKSSSKFSYFYKKDGALTDYTWNSAEKKKGYTKLGSARITAYACAVKKDKKKKIEWDNVYSICTVGVFHKRCVDYYNYKMSVPDTGKHEIMDETWIGSGKKVSTSIGATVSTSGASVTASETYSYNVCSQDVENQLGYQYKKIWRCTPNEELQNQSYKIKPAILVKHKGADKYKTTVYCNLQKYRIWGGVRYYTIDDDLKLTFKFSRFGV